jgi:hypothetical protein
MDFAVDIFEKIVLFGGAIFYAGVVIAAAVASFQIIFLNKKKTT